MRRGDEFTYMGHVFRLSNTTTAVMRNGRERYAWIIECDGPCGWRAGFQTRPTTKHDAKELLRSRLAKHAMRGGDQ